MNMIAKPAYNEEFRTCEFRRPDGTGPLNAEETIQTVVAVTCTESATGIDYTATMIASAAVYNNTQVRYQLKGGERGTNYLRTIKIITSNAQKFIDEMMIKVT